MYSSSLPSSIRYAVGQPMGALSSWAMLALTHHFILQYCAWTTYTVPVGTMFTEYAVLGDDVLIWNKKVAARYLRVLHLLGVEVGLAKSVISNKGLGFEFAKRTILQEGDVSPIPFKEMSSAHLSATSLVAFMNKYDISINRALRFLGYGYKVDSTKNNKAVTAINIALNIPKTYSDILKLFSMSLDKIKLVDKTGAKEKSYSFSYVDSTQDINKLRLQVEFINFT